MSKQKLRKTGLILLKIFAIAAFIIFSNLYLQWCQNNLSVELALKFAFSWHTAKFFLACLVLLLLYGFFASIAGSLWIGGIFYTVVIGVLGYADYLKMAYRQEPVYPDDLKMITQWGMLRELIGTGPFILVLLCGALATAASIWSIYKSKRLKKRLQLFRAGVLLTCIAGLLYASHFNDEKNLLRKAYNQTALWIPYSQKMNYYNTGFIGGFLFNLRVEAMEKPKDYSADKVKQIAKKYTKLAEEKNKDRKEEKPNIVYVMSESFSDPTHLNGLTVTGNPLEDYYTLAKASISGKMLSQNYGGGTANIEFEALTSFSMGLLNPQMTTPYTMLLPKMTVVPSLVSFLTNQGYQTTAIHPYDTSMYKRKDVYGVFGFNEFLHQDTMTYTDKIGNNPYISDESAYQEVLAKLKAEQKPQFVHLVTMQTHMPYTNKYTTLDYEMTGDSSDRNSIENYLQDIAYSSQALKQFMAELEKLPKRTLVVFWGDHLPGIYSEELQQKNEEITMHQTEFAILDSKKQLPKRQLEISSPFYFAPNLMEYSQQKTNGLYELLLLLQEKLPAFEKGMYYQEDSWKKEVSLSGNAKTYYQDYQMMQYDILQGKQYSLQTDFFTDS